MDDFLDGVRNGQIRKQLLSRPQANRNTDFQHNNRKFHFRNAYQSNNHQRPPVQNKSGNQPPAYEISQAILQKSVENLCSLTETLEINQEVLINAQEKTADMMERQVVAIDKILDPLPLF